MNEKIQIASVQCAEQYLNLTIVELETGQKREKIRFFLDLELLILEANKNINLN